MRKNTIIFFIFLMCLNSISLFGKKDGEIEFLNDTDYEVHVIFFFFSDSTKNNWLRKGYRFDSREKKKISTKVKDYYGPIDNHAANVQKMGITVYNYDVLKGPAKDVSFYYEKEINIKEKKTTHVRMYYKDGRFEFEVSKPK